MAGCRLVPETSRNAEPRSSQLYPPVKVTLLDDPEAELDCLLTHISLTDIKVLAADSLRGGRNYRD